MLRETEKRMRLASVSPFAKSVESRAGEADGGEVARLFVVGPDKMPCTYFQRMLRETENG